MPGAGLLSRGEGRSRAQHPEPANPAPRWAMGTLQEVTHLLHLQARGRPGTLCHCKKPGFSGQVLPHGRRTGQRAFFSHRQGQGRCTEGTGCCHPNPLSLDQGSQHPWEVLSITGNSDPEKRDLKQQRKGSPRTQTQSIPTSGKAGLDLAMRPKSQS